MRMLSESLFAEVAKETAKKESISVETGQKAVNSLRLLMSLYKVKIFLLAARLSLFLKRCFHHSLLVIYLTVIYTLAGPRNSHECTLKRS